MRSATLKSLNISRDSLVLDGQPPPTLQQGKCISMPYCDNVHCMATDPKVCQDGCNSICHDLEGMVFSFMKKRQLALIAKHWGVSLMGSSVKYGQQTRGCGKLFLVLSIYLSQGLTP